MATMPEAETTPDTTSTIETQTSSPNKLLLCRIWVAICRILVGMTFIISGWAKSIDIWGGIYKVNEYLSVWGITFPREAILMGCILLAILEFTIGVCIFFGTLKRVAVWVATLFMLFMLPLTGYIAFSNPVSDCGCFGDFITISNTQTFIKNILLSAAIVYLIIFNRCIKGIFANPLQWLVITFTIATCILIAFLGYKIQPLIDFRTHPVNTEIFGNTSSETDEKYIYERDGIRQEFTLDQLPDSSWTFFDIVIPNTDTDLTSYIAVYDNDGYDVSEEIVDHSKDQLFLIIQSPGLGFLTRNHYIQGLNDYMTNNNVEMIGIVAGEKQQIAHWKELNRPRFNVYTANSNALKELVRGDNALVYTRNGKILWKRNLGSMPPEPPADSLPFDEFVKQATINGHLQHAYILSASIGSLVILYLIGRRFYLQVQN